MRLITGSVVYFIAMLSCVVLFVIIIHLQYQTLATNEDLQNEINNDKKIVEITIKLSLQNDDQCKYSCTVIVTHNR